MKGSKRNRWKVDEVKLGRSKLRKVWNRKVRHSKDISDYSGYRKIARESKDVYNYIT